MINILEYCRLNSIKKLIFLSSYVYGKPDYLPIDENHSLNPINYYGFSKLELGNINRVLSSFSFNYEKKWRKLRGKKHEKYYRIKEAIFRFDDDDLNRIADGIAAVKEEDRSLMKLFSIAVSKKPTLLIDVMRLFTGL